jgi:hypothetical protein
MSIEQQACCMKVCDGPNCTQAIPDTSAEAKGWMQVRRHNLAFANDFCSLDCLAAWVKAEQARRAGDAA